MDFLEYRELCKRTESTVSALNEEALKTGITDRMVHCTMGIATEFDEWMLACKAGDSVNALEELGDMYWFLAICSLDINYLNVRNVTAEYNSDALDACKASMFYGRTLHLPMVQVSLKRLHLAVDMFTKQLASTPEKVWEINIKKLKIRYPEKFTTENSNNRNLKEERKVLEDASKT